VKKSKPVLAWGGFCDGKLDWSYGMHADETLRSIYRTRREAARFFTDCRRVEIREVRPRKQKAGKP
jgi:hypothetical protein